MSRSDAPWNTLATRLTPGAAAAQTTRTGDFASGAGFWHGDDPDDPGPGSVGFQVSDLVAADNEFDYRRQSDGRGFHAAPVCISVQGNEAWMVLVVQRSDLPDVPPVFVAYMANSGNGQTDLFDLDVPVTNLFDDRCGTRTVVFEPDPVRGKINLADEGVFGSPF